jgi:hypothetical protein
MNTQTAGNGSLNIIAPDWRASHGWIGLFSVAPMTSVRVWIDGIVFSVVFSVVFGWVGAVVFGLVYNYFIHR